MKEDTTTLSRRYIRVQSYHSDSSFNSVQLLTNYTMPAPDNSHVSRYTGNKQFEIANHLGNVLSTVTDRKIQESTSPYTIVRFWNPDVHTVTDYYPFGAPMPGRNLSMPECYTMVTVQIVRMS